MPSRPDRHRGLPRRVPSALGFWDEERYERQWRKAIERVVAGERSSCLLTSISSAWESESVPWWAIWRLDGEVAFH
ncbi:MAG: hypothetical protein ACJ74X_07695, partial [Gaiellaceae bacterium]